MHSIFNEVLLTHCIFIFIFCSSLFTTSYFPPAHHNFYLIISIYFLSPNLYHHWNIHETFPVGNVERLKVIFEFPGCHDDEHGICKMQKQYSIIPKDNHIQVSRLWFINAYALIHIHRAHYFHTVLQFQLVFIAHLIRDFISIIHQNATNLVNSLAIDAIISVPHQKHTQKKFSCTNTYHQALL